MVCVGGAFVALGFARCARACIQLQGPLPQTRTRAASTWVSPAPMQPLVASSPIGVRARQAFVGDEGGVRGCWRRECAVARTSCASGVAVKHDAGFRFDARRTRAHGATSRCSHLLQMSGMRAQPSPTTVCQACALLKVAWRVKQTASELNCAFAYVEGGVHRRPCACNARAMRAPIFSTQTRTPTRGARFPHNTHTLDALIGTRSGMFEDPRTHTHTTHTHHNNPDAHTSPVRLRWTPAATARPTKRERASRTPSRVCWRALTWR